MLELSGFPEPYLSNSKREFARWTRQYRSLIIREDLKDLERTTELNKIELLSLRLPELVGSPLSLNSLREDLNVSHRAVTSWCNILERLYFIFRLSPFGAPSIKAVKKERKHYLYNWAAVPEEGARLENLVASHLLKWVHYRQDFYGEDIELKFFRDIEKREVDFIISKGSVPLKAVECKVKSRKVSTSLKYFKKKFPDASAYQIELYCPRPYQTEDGINVMPVLDFLQRLI